MKLSKEFIAMFREEAKKAQWEINRWNGKSIDDLVVDYLERKELKPEDFTGAVILTVDEASNVWDSLVNLVSYVESIDGGMSDLVRDGQSNIDLIRNRIKKTEVQDEIK